MEQMSSREQELEARVRELEDLLDEKRSTIRQEEKLKDIGIDTLDLDEYKRYGRQLIMPEIGLRGQIALKKSRVLVVGAGGLGCPAMAYLAGSGIGTLGIIDGDIVEESNLHRQIIHSMSTIGVPKAYSAERFILNLNPKVAVQPYIQRLEPHNSLEIFQNYDLILDCTDNPATRYLISDSAVILGIPVISASALKTEGQLAVLNFKTNGPCYRCLFPHPPPPESVTSCGDGGILGPVVGIMGIYQAIEAIKVLTGAYDNYQEFLPTLTFFSAFSTPSWRSMRMRGKRKDCFACGTNSALTKESFTVNGNLDYVHFCGLENQNFSLSNDQHISVEELSKMHPNDYSLIDVRAKAQFDICALPNSVNLPLEDLITEKAEIETALLDKPMYVVCRRGIDSQTAVDWMSKSSKLSKLNAKNVRGGLESWSKNVDPNFPVY